MHRHLVEQAMAGDHDAFAELARARIGRLYAIAVLILRDPGRAEDATQEALVAAWRDLSALRDPDRFDAWLRRLLVRACYRESQAGPEPSDDRRARAVDRADRALTDRPPWPIATRSSAGSAASTPTSARSSSCTTTSASPSRRWPMPSESPWGPRSRGSTARPARFARRSTPTRAAHSRSKGGRHEHERRRPPPLRLAGNGRSRARAGAPARRGARADRANEAPAGLADPRKVDPDDDHHDPGDVRRQRPLAGRRAHGPARARPRGGRRPRRRLAPACSPGAVRACLERRTSSTTSTATSSPSTSSPGRAR